MYVHCAVIGSKSSSAGFGIQDRSWSTRALEGGPKNHSWLRLTIPAVRRNVYPVRIPYYVYRLHSLIRPSLGILEALMFRQRHPEVRHDVRFVATAAVCGRSFDCLCNLRLPEVDN